MRSSHRSMPIEETDVTDRTAPEAPPPDLAGLPIQPTGSGVADLEVAYEQMRLANAADPASDLAEDNALSATRDAGDEVEAHPS